MRRWASSSESSDQDEDGVDYKDEDSPHWIDPDLLEEKFDDCVCVACCGVMVEPTSGCPEGHSFCRGCYGKALRRRRECPTCRRPTNELKLVRMRPLEGVIAQLRVQCKHSNGERYYDPDEAGHAAAKRAKLAPAAAMSAKSLRQELGQRGLDSTGGKPELAARLEDDRKKVGGCRWRGRVGELGVHLGGCEWAPVKCPNKGCAESPLRRDLPEHGETCDHRVITCNLCGSEMAHQSLTKHEESCPEAVIECPNEGCVVLDRRGAMDEHREECEHEEVTCPSPGCDARVLRKKVSAHVRSRHLQKAEEQLQRLWLENARLKAASESELRHTAASPTSWVFNWRADGWGGGWFESEPHDFRGGVAGKCVLKLSSNPERSHFIGFMVEGGGQCRVHLTFSLLDTHDKTLRQVHQIGTARAPVDKLFKAFRYWGRTFTPTAEEKAQSVRSDGSVRLRAEVRLFPYGPA